MECSDDNKWQCDKECLASLGRSYLSPGRESEPTVVRPWGRFLWYVADQETGPEGEKDTRKEGILDLIL